MRITGFILMIIGAIIELAVGLSIWFITIPLFLIGALLVTIGTAKHNAKNEKKAAVKLMLFAAACDGNLAPEEGEKIKEIAAKKGISDKLVNEVVQEMQKKDFTFQVPDDEDDKKMLLTYVGHIIMADNIITKEEEEYFKVTGKGIGLSEETVNSMLGAIKK